MLQSRLQRCNLNSRNRVNRARKKKRNGESATVWKRGRKRRSVWKRKAGVPTTLHGESELMKRGYQNGTNTKKKKQTPHTPLGKAKKRKKDEKKNRQTG